MYDTGDDSVLGDSFITSESIKVKDETQLPSEKSIVDNKNLNMDLNPIIIRQEQEDDLTDLVVHRKYGVRKHLYHYSL